ncbi:MAG: hypothetical protein ACO1NW_18020 [Chitinophagaceae bacterium]
MQENEFEKQVRHQLEQLQFKPSDEVWLKVEQEIRSRKRRRIMFWIPAAAAMLALSFGAWWFIGKENGAGQQASIAETRGEQRIQPKTGAEKGDAVKVTDEASAATNDMAVVPEEKNATTSAGVSAEEKGTSGKTDVLPSAGKKKQRLYPENSTGNALAARKKDAEKKASSIKELLDNKMLNSAIVHNRPADGNFGKQVQGISGALGTEIASLQHSKINADELIVTRKIVSAPLISDKENTQKDLTTMLQGKLVSFSTPYSRQTKWTYGITASGGASWPVYNGAAAEKISVADNTFAGSIGLAPIMRPTLVAPMAPVGVRPAAEPGAAFSFTAGIYGGREWKGKFGVKAGAQYTQLNTEYKVGDYVSYAGQVNLAGVNAPLRSYYQNGTAYNYTSNYHFLELPVEGAYTLNSRSRMPVSVTAGGTVSYLMKTDGLHYDKINGIYYEDINLYNRTQVSLQTGVSVKLLQSGKQSLSAGPVFRYSLTPNRDKEMFQQEHLTYLGLRVAFGLR